MLHRPSSDGGAPMLMVANGSAMVGEPVCAAGVIEPEAVPAACASPAESAAPPATEMSALDCTRHLGAVISEVSPSATSWPFAAPDESTHSGIWPSVAAVAWACMDQPPGGSRLPKNELRLPVSDTVTLELSDAIVVATFRWSRLATT